MAGQPPLELYSAEQAFADCMADMAQTRDCLKNDPDNAPLLEALIKLRSEATMRSGDVDIFRRIGTPSPEES